MEQTECEMHHQVWVNISFGVLVLMLLQQSIKHFWIKSKRYIKFRTEENALELNEIFIIIKILGAMSNSHHCNDGWLADWRLCTLFCDTKTCSCAQRIRTRSQSVQAEIKQDTKHVNWLLWEMQKARSEFVRSKALKVHRRRNGFEIQSD